MNTPEPPLPKTTKFGVVTYGEGRGFRSATYAVAFAHASRGLSTIAEFLVKQGEIS